MKYPEFFIFFRNVKLYTGLLFSIQSQITDHTFMTLINWLHVLVYLQIHQIQMLFIIKRLDVMCIHEQLLMLILSI